MSQTYHGSPQQRSANYGPGAGACFYINKVFLEHSHALPLQGVSGCFQATVAEVSSYHKDRMTYKHEVFTIWLRTENVWQPLSNNVQLIFYLMCKDLKDELRARSPHHSSQRPLTQPVPQ